MMTGVYFAEQNHYFNVMTIRNFDPNLVLTSNLEY